jgi:hypothetical protein
MAVAESRAISAMVAFITTEEGQRASDDDLRLWLVDRGWPPSKLRAWTERISAQLSLANPEDADPRALTARLSVRLERLAHRAEEMNDMKHAIEATKAQAQLGKVGGFAPVAQQQVSVTITNANAHLVSDDELLRVANAKQVDARVVATEQSALDLDPLLA